MKIRLILTAIIALTAMQLLGQWDMKNPVVKGYFERYKGVIDAIDLSDSVRTNLVSIKKSKKYLKVYFDVYNQSGYYVNARIPIAEDLKSGEIHCYISCGSEEALYNPIFSNWRFNLISDENSVLIDPHSHYTGSLKLKISNIERALGCSLSHKTKNRPISIEFCWDKPERLMTQFKYFSYFNIEKNKISYP